MVGDVAKASDAQALAETAVERYGRIDILDLTEEDWERVMDTNAKGIYLCCKAVIPVRVAERL